MPKNKNFELRLSILDELLGSPRRRSINDLLDSLNDHLLVQGERKVSRRTLYNDLNALEYQKGAPIVRPKKGQPHIYYGEKFSLKNIPIDEEEVSALKQAISILRSITDISIVGEVDAIVSKLENKIHTNVPERSKIIAFDEHTRAVGQQFIQDLFDAIKAKSAVKITYRPFNKGEREWIVSPYLLKEYNNRWFLLCKKTELSAPTTISLDRIIRIKNSNAIFQENTLFNPETYFDNMIGVTLPDDGIIHKILLTVTPESADYILTKPIHKSQKVVERYDNGFLRIELELYINFELKSHLLSYGPAIEVNKPIHLRAEIYELINKTLNSYA